MRGQGNEISICWREEEINMEGEKTGTLKGHKSERERERKWDNRKSNRMRKEKEVDVWKMRKLSGP